MDVDADLDEKKRYLGQVKSISCNLPHHLFFIHLSSHKLKQFIN